VRKALVLVNARVTVREVMVERVATFSKRHVLIPSTLTVGSKGGLARLMAVTVS
jgi:hypothetical protein